MKRVLEDQINELNSDFKLLKIIFRWEIYNYE